MKTINRLIKSGLKLVGYDIIRISQIPHHTFMGLRNLPIKTVLDVGANTGLFAQMVSTTYPEAHIHCFEPLPEVYQELLEWANKSNGQVTAYNLALGEKEDMVTMNYHTNHHYSSSLLRTTKYVEDLFPQTEKQVVISVKQTTLNKWMEELNHIMRPDILIKLDVQGYEDRVIRGGINLFAMAKACILEINLADLYHGQASFRDIFLLFDELGYSYSGNFDQVHGIDGQVIYIDALFLKN